LLDTSVKKRTGDKWLAEVCEVMVQTAQNPEFLQILTSCDSLEFCSD